jgi:uncharacterized protein (TIGR02145 family)
MTFLQFNLYAVMPKKRKLHHNKIEQKCYKYEPFKKIKEMRKKQNIWICPFILMAMIIILTNSCKKYNTATTPNGTTVTDIDGNIYRTVTIGTQTWMAENLKTTKYKNGTAIPLVTDATVWGNLTTSGYCWYDNNIDNKVVYGALYNWYTVNTSNLCPTGWHVPTDAEWEILTDYLGGIGVAGGKLKETDTTHWTSPNTGATNETGFTALPGGLRAGHGPFLGVWIVGYWWSSTEIYTSTASNRTMFRDGSNVFSSDYTQSSGFSVRCLRDN